MTNIPSVEKEIEYLRFAMRGGCNCKGCEDDRANIGEHCVIRQALTAEREAGREEERANIPVSFLRQWINEDIKQPHQELVTNEDIMRFINIGYGK